ncbi:MAG: carbohydrate kinase, partial [Sphingobacteriia bacterium]
KKTGGAPTNVAAAIGALGGAVSLMAQVGQDPFGDQLVDTMNSFGCDTRFMTRDSQAFTTLAFVSLMENGERDFVFSRGADGNLDLAQIKDFSLSDFSMVHFGSATAFLPGALQATYKNLLQAAKAQGLFVAFDPNYRHLLYKDSIPSFVAQSQHFLAHCDFFKLSDEEALLLTGTQDLGAAVAGLRQISPAVFAITLGAAGTLLGWGDTTLTIPSIPISPVDTTGAGDAFVGALLFLLQNKAQTHGLSALRQLTLSDWEALVAQANKAGARTCEYLGAMEAFRHLNRSIFDA